MTVTEVEIFDRYVVIDGKIKENRCFANLKVPHNFPFSFYAFATHIWLYLSLYIDQVSRGCQELDILTDFKKCWRPNTIYVMRS